MNLYKLPFEKRKIYDLYISIVGENLKLRDLFDDIKDNDPIDLTKYGLYWKSFVEKYINV